MRQDASSELRAHSEAAPCILVSPAPSAAPMQTPSANLAVAAADHSTTTNAASSRPLRPKMASYEPTLLLSWDKSCFVIYADFSGRLCFSAPVDWLDCCRIKCCALKQVWVPQS